MYVCMCVCMCIFFIPHMLFFSLSLAFVEYLYNMSYFTLDALMYLFSVF